MDDTITVATRDQVIMYAKDWLVILAESQRWLQFNPAVYEGTQERQDVMKACVDLAYNRTKESLVAYAKHREKFFAEHDKMLDTIEELLQENIKDIKDDGQMA